MGNYHMASALDRRDPCKEQKHVRGMGMGSYKVEPMEVSKTTSGRFRYVLCRNWGVSGDLVGSGVFSSHKVKHNGACPEIKHRSRGREGGRYVACVVEGYVPSSLAVSLNSS